MYFAVSIYQKKARVIQKILTIGPLPRGLHLITDKILKSLGTLPQTGMLNIFIQHSSAGICISENTDPDVAVDLNQFFDDLAPEKNQYLHISEGRDDMPAHIKNVVSGVSLNIPVKEGRLGLGVWQGVYLCEYRNQGGTRRIILTLMS